MQLILKDAETMAEKESNQNRKAYFQGYANAIQTMMQRVK